MAENLRFKNPWLIAVWPGMGHVAVTAGYYLMAKLEMNLFTEFVPHEVFEVDHVQVDHGLIRPGQLPRSRMFHWQDPEGKRDLLLFIGEAQPPTGKYAFCNRLIERAIGLGVERVFTFAAMGTSMDMGDDARVFGAATDSEGVDELRRLQLNLVEDGTIGGLNGVLLGVAAERGLRGTCLLGEMPGAMPLLPYPKASLAVLEVFATIAGVTVDFDELREQSRLIEQRIGELIEGIKADGSPDGTRHEYESSDEFTPREGELAADVEQTIETLFEQVKRDRSQAYHLKAELDRLGVFDRYEDRFLDLFKSEG